MVPAQAWEPHMIENHIHYVFVYLTHVGFMFDAVTEYEYN